MERVPMAAVQPVHSRNDDQVNETSDERDDQVNEMIR